MEEWEAQDSLQASRPDEGELLLTFFSVDIRKALVVAAVIALPILSINMRRGPDEAPWYRAPFDIAASSFQSGVSGFATAVRGTVSLYLNLVGIRSESKLLRQENEELKAKLNTNRELELENQRLSELLQFKKSTKMELVAAQVIGLDLSPDHNSVRINRGYLDGLRKWMGVVSVEGVVGYIISTELHTSQVLLLTDRSAAIDTIVQRTRARGLLGGKDSGTLRLRYLERAEDVEQGDAVVTSGQKGFFPKGYPVGKVVDVRKTDLGISLEATVEPTVRPGRIEDVFVVLKTGDDDFNQMIDERFGPPLLSKSNAARSVAQ